MKTIYLWVSGKGWTPFQYNELSELAAEFKARNIKLGNECELGDGCELGAGLAVSVHDLPTNPYEV